MVFIVVGQKVVESILKGFFWLLLQLFATCFKEEIIIPFYTRVSWLFQQIFLGYLYYFYFLHLSRFLYFSLRVFFSLHLVLGFSRPFFFSSFLLFSSNF